MRIQRLVGWYGFVVCLLAALSTGCSTGSLHTPSAPQESKETGSTAPLSEPQRRGLFPVSLEERQQLCAALSPQQQGATSWNDFRFALKQSLAHAANKPAKQPVLVTESITITYGDLVHTLRRLKQLLPRLDAQPELLIDAFQWWRVEPDFGFTGYYEPELLASPVQTSRFRYPLYATPPELATWQDTTPYHTREAIDGQGILQGRGLELAWVESPIDVFMLQIQGSGRLRYEDGSVCSVLFDAHNGHHYVSLGRVLVERGLIPQEAVSMKTIRQWLTAHPEQRDALLYTNPRYIFFRLAKEQGIYGSMGRRLTPWISVATDPQTLPHGLLTFMRCPLPNPTNTNPRVLHGLFLPQDTGRAIQDHRVDLFCGHGEYAAQTAGFLDADGAVYILLAP